MLRALIFALALATAATGGQAAEALLQQSCIPESHSQSAALDRLPACEGFVSALNEGDPAWRVTLEARIKLEQLTGRWDKAMSLLDIAVAHFPASEDLRLQRIAMSRSFRMGGKVLEDLEYLRRRGSEDPRFWREYGMFQRSVGADDDALAAFDNGLARAPEDKLLLYARTAVLRALERMPEALVAADALVHAAPADREPRILRADLLLLQNRPEAALEDIDAARAFGPSGVDDTSLLLARAEAMLDKPRQTLSAADAALADPWAVREPWDLRRALTLRFGALQKLGDTAAADETLGRLLEALDTQQLLRIQVLLKNLGWNDVAITGQVHPAMRAAMSACVFQRSCGGKLQAI